MPFGLWATLAKIAFWLVVLLPVAPVFGWFERRAMALIQVDVGRNWRITFTFDGGDCDEVDYEDYH